MASYPFRELSPKMQALLIELREQLMKAIEVRAADAAGKISNKIFLDTLEETRNLIDKIPKSTEFLRLPNMLMRMFSEDWQRKAFYETTLYKGLTEYIEGKMKLP